MFVLQRTIYARPTFLGLKLSMAKSTARKVEKMNGEFSSGYSSDYNVRDYSIIFPTLYDARKVKRVVGPQPSMRLFKDVKTVLQLDKQRDCYITDYFTKEISLDEMINLHLYNDMGIIMFDELVDEDSTSLAYSCDLFHPNYNLIRKN